MLYDPKWEVQTETKDDPFSLGSLIAWLEKQDPNAQYCFHAWNDCLLAQWLHSGVDQRARTSWDFLTGFHYKVNGQIVDLRHFQKIAAGEPRTFGAALKRARAQQS